MINSTAIQEYETNDDDDLGEVEGEERQFLKGEMLQAEEPRPRKNVRKPKASLPDLSTGVPIGTRIAQDEWKKLKILEKHYGVERPQDALRLAIYDAYDHVMEVEPQEQPQAYTDLLASQAALTKQLKRLTDQLETTVVSEVKEPQEEPQEEVSPYDPEAIAYFKNLDSKGKKYLTEKLNGNPNARSLGSMPPWKREINAHINKVAPHDGYHRSAPATRQARRGLYDFLVQEKILPK